MPTNSKAPAIPKPTTDGSMWGYSLVFWDKISLWTLVWGMLFGAGAVFLTGVSSFISLRTSSIAQATTQQATADAKAEGERAGEAAARATEQAAALESQTAALQLANTQLQVRLEEERVNRIKLQTALSSRHLSPEQSDTIANAVSGRLPTVIHAFTSDQESLAFVQDIAAALERGGVKVVPQGSGVMVPTPYGLAVTIRPEAQVLADALKAAQIDARVTVIPGAQTSILVGHKPPAF